MSARKQLEARAIADKALKAAEAEFGGGLLVGQTRYAVVVVVHQLGEEPGGLAIGVATNLVNNAAGFEKVALEGLRVYRGQARTI